MYKYDVTGNILEITEQTPGCGVRNNPEALRYPELQTLLGAGNALVRRFEYDPLYRLTLATGREANNIPLNGRPWTYTARDGFNWGPPGMPTLETARDQTRIYEETYSYDAADNILTMNHGRWTRHFGISGFTPQVWAQEWRVHLDPSNAWAATPNNRLTHMGDTKLPVLQNHFFDANGNLIRQNTEQNFAWDVQDRMMAFANRTTSGKATVEACYLYDSSGKRTKKLVRKGANVEVTIYIDDVFEHRIFGAYQNNTLQVMDNQVRISLVRVGPPPEGDSGPIVQYHISDHLGSSNIVVGGDNASATFFINREEFFPYGESTLGCFESKRYRFMGKEKDEESGLQYYGARYFWAPAARWISADRIAVIGARSNPYAAFLENPLTYIDSNGQFSITNHYNYTKAAASKLGYDIQSADFVAHFASVYADNPGSKIVAGNNVTGLGKGSNQLYRSFFDYSATARSQDTTSPEFSSWHAMAADGEKISPEAATRRGQEFGWSKIISAGEAFKGDRTRIAYRNGYVLEEQTVGQIALSHQSVLGDLGQGIHALQDAIRHKGVHMKGEHSIPLDINPPSGEAEKAEAAAFNGLIIFELLSGDTKHLNLIQGAVIDVSSASSKQFTKIRDAVQATLDKSKPNPNLTIRLKGPDGEIELRQRSEREDRVDAGTREGARPHQ